MPNILDHITACATVPDQLIPYVRAVSGLESEAVGPHVLHQGDGYGVLVAYGGELEESVALAANMPHIRHLTVLAPARPAAAPESAAESRDSYWFLPLPAPAPGQKLRNMLARARRSVTVGQSGGGDSWTPAHAALAQGLCERKKTAVDDGTRHIFSRLGAYLANAPDARLFSAHDLRGNLAGCAIGDFSALSTAFYMFAFRSPGAPPGTADALLGAIIDEAARRGHGSLNLGLGIDGGVAFFKRKWGATPDVPLVETSWTIPKKSGGWLKRIFGGA